MDETGKVSRFIRSLGGQKIVAEGLGNNTPITTVNSWMMRENIPDWRLRDLLRLANKKGVLVPRWFMKRVEELK